MKALMYLGIGTLAMSDIPEPENDFIVKVAGCGICGTDLKTYRNGHHMFTPPAVLGHEFYGTVSKAPARSGYRTGEKVVVAPYYECGSCGLCAIDAGELCRTKSFIDGGAFCEYVGMPASYLDKGVYRLPSDSHGGEADDVFTLVEPLACVLNGVERLRIRPTSRVLIVGSGPMGALFALLLKSRGVKAAVVEPIKARRERVASWGVDAFEPGEVDASRYDNIVIAVNSASLFNDYIKKVADAGTVLMFGGLPKGESVAVDSYAIHYREVSLAGSYGYALPHFRKALSIIEERGADFADLITHRMPLSEGKKAFDLLAAGEAFKIVLRP